MEPNADRREHPTPEELHCFLSDTATRDERRRVTVHLLRGCESCALILRGALRPELPSEGAYDEVLLRFTHKLARVPAIRDSVLRPDNGGIMSEERSRSLLARDRKTVQREIEEIASELEALGVRLRTVLGSLPVSPREDLMLLGEEDPDYSCVIRGAIECSLDDHLRIVVETLRTAARSEAT